METFFVVLISGMAAGYVVEFLVTFTERFFSAKILRAIFTLPLSYLAAWLLGLTGLTLIVSGLASAFFALIVIGLTIKPTVVQGNLTRRL
jgi:hypothetical protein